MAAFALTPEACAEKIARAGKIAALTGAGISTAAGVPDFRGPRGLYATRAYDPDTVFDIGHFDRDPAPFCRFSRDFLALLENLEPTFTHRFLAELPAAESRVGIITQNIDGLHQRAGSTTVYPLHGDYETAHCRRCKSRYGGEELRRRLKEEEVPRCALCGGVLKPDVVFFGENVLFLREAERLVRASDLLLVLGSSLVVYPAAFLPEYAAGDVVVVNRGETGIRPGPATHVVDADLDGYFREVAACLE